MSNLAEYLADAVNLKSIDFRLRVVNTDTDGKVECYLHPLNTDGETLDFVVNGNAIEFNLGIGKPCKCTPENQAKFDELSPEFLYYLSGRTEILNSENLKKEYMETYYTETGF